jgi:hypothetical protein
MVFACKKCKKVFRKDMTEYDESDEYCPHCDNHYVSHSSNTFEIQFKYSLQVLDAKTPQAVLAVEGEDARVDARCVFRAIFETSTHQTTLEG